MMIIFLNRLILMILFCAQLLAQTYDYQKINEARDSLKVGLGSSYSKLEGQTGTVGNYFLLSQANPRVELSYETSKTDLFAHRFSLFFVIEQYRPENSFYRLKTTESQGSFSLNWEPIWTSESQLFTYGFKFGVKNSSVISLVPNTFEFVGDIANRYSGQASILIQWYGLTVSKFPIVVDFAAGLSQTLWHHSNLKINNGNVYQAGFEFSFKKKTLFEGWAVRGFYEYEDLKNEIGPFVDKEIGFVLSKSFQK
jgi:hypothetical protein